MSTITVIEKPVNEELIKVLEGCLLRAKQGQISGAVIIQSWDDNSTNHAWAGANKNRIRIAGELFIAATSLAGHVEADRSA